MGVHAHDFEPASPVERQGCIADRVAAVRWTSPETNLAFLSRRAMEESRLAQAARNPRAAAAHRYLAAAYSAEIARELATAASLEELLLELP